MPANRMAESDFLLFNRQLVALVKTSLPLSHGLAMLSKEARKPSLRRAIDDVHRDVEAGQPLSKAVADRGSVFPKLYAKIIEAGERSNNLVGVLAQFAQYSETMATMKQRLKDVLMYPAFVLASALVLAGFFIFLVLPQMISQVESTFLEFGGEDFLEYYGSGETSFLWNLTKILPTITLSIMGLVLLAVVIALVLRTRPGGRVVLDGIKMRLPFYGRCYRFSLLSRFAETLSVLLRSNVPLGDALYLAGECSPSPVLCSASSRVQHRVEHGQKLSDAVASEPFLGSMLAYMISIGEKREAPAEELESAAELLSTNLQSRARWAAMCIDTIVLVFVAILVLFLARLIYNPLILIIRMMGEGGLSEG